MQPYPVRTTPSDKMDESVIDAPLFKNFTQDFGGEPSHHCDFGMRRQSSVNIPVEHMSRTRRRFRPGLPTSSAIVTSLFNVVMVLFLSLPTTSNASQAAGTETLVGIVGKDFVLLMADSSVSQNIALTASNLDKIATVSDPFPHRQVNDDDNDNHHNKIQRRRQMAIAAAAAGDPADSDRLLGYLRAYATMEEYQNGWGCDVQVVSCSSHTKNNNNQGNSLAGLQVDAVAHWTRRFIADSLRSAPMRVCLLIAGMQYLPPRYSLRLEETDSSGDVTIQPARADDVPVRDNNNNNVNHKPFPSLMVQHQVKSAWGVVPSANDEGGISEMDALTKAQSKPSSSRYEPRLYWLDEYGSLQQVQYGAHGFGASFLLSILDRGYRDNMSLEEAVALAKDCFRELRNRYLINSPTTALFKVY